MRIATWNVERPKPRGWKIPQAQKRRMAEVDADIWLLTETHVGHQPTPAHEHFAFSPAHPTRRPEHERWAAIWSKWPVTLLDDPAPHRRGSVAAIVDSPVGPIVVYACVIAWRNEREFDDGTPAGSWEVHHAEVERQVAEWRRIRELHPDVPLVIGGDFNQDRDGSGWYGTDRSRAAVTKGLADCGLVCVTEFDAVATGRLTDQHLVDHLCIPREWAGGAEVTVIPRTDADGMRLSDHPTVFVDVAR